VVEHRSERQAEPADSIVRALAATSRIKPLFPERLAGLASDEAWIELAGSVRTQAADVLAAGDYPLPAFYQEEDEVVARVAGTVYDRVLGGRDPGELPSGDVGEVVRELVDHRIRASPADRAGRRLAAATSEFDLVTFAWQTRMTPTAKEEDDLLAFSDMEICYFVSGRNASVVVDKTSRGSQRRVLGRFSSELDALRFLVMLLAVNRRRRTALELAPGVTLEDGPTATHLTWAGGWADFPKGIGGRGNALDFSRVIDRSLEWIALPPAENA
jgi:hypothetical protein